MSSQITATDSVLIALASFITNDGEELSWPSSLLNQPNRLLLVGGTAVGEQIYRGATLVIGEFIIEAAPTTDDQEPFEVQLQITIHVANAAYTLPVRIQLRTASGVVLASLGAMVPFTIIFEHFAVQVLGMTKSRTSVDYLATVDVPPGSSTSVFLHAKVIETPEDGPEPAPGTAISAFNDRECLTDVDGSPLPTLPELPPLIPPSPPLIDCEIPEVPELLPIPEPDPPLLTAPGPPPVPIAPLPGGGGGGGTCQPKSYYTTEKKYGCNKPPEVRTRPVGRCDTWVHIIVYECNPTNNCCTFLCCDGEWKPMNTPEPNSPYGGTDPGSYYNSGVEIATLRGDSSGGGEADCKSGAVYWFRCEEPLTPPSCWKYVGHDSTGTVSSGTWYVYEGCNPDGLSSLTSAANGLEYSSGDGTYPEHDTDNFTRLGDVDDLCFNRTTTTTTAHPCAGYTPTAPCSEPGQAITICDCEDEGPQNEPCPCDPRWIIFQDDLSDGSLTSEPIAPGDIPRCWAWVATATCRDPQSGYVDKVAYLFAGCGLVGQQTIQQKRLGAMDIENSGTGYYDPMTMAGEFCDVEIHTDSPNCCTGIPTTTTTTTTTTATPNPCSGELACRKFHVYGVPLGGDADEAGSVPPCTQLLAHWRHDYPDVPESVHVFLYEACDAADLDHIEAQMVALHPNNLVIEQCSSDIETQNQMSAANTVVLTALQPHLDCD